MATQSQLRQAGLRDMYVTGLQSDVDAYLRDQINAIKRAIDAGGVGDYTPRQLNRMLNELLEQIGANYEQFVAVSGETASQLAMVDVETEAGLIAQTQGAPATIPPQNRIQQALQNVTFTDWAKKETLTATEVVSRLGKTNGKIIESTIRAGYADGASNREILQQLIGKRYRHPSGGYIYRGGYINNAHRRDTMTTVRTVTNTISQTAREQVWLENEIKMVEYVATLDNRTTLICAGYDGTRWRISNKNRPKPPLHWNCRSTTVAVLHKGDSPLEFRNARGADNINPNSITSTRVWQKKRRTIRAEVPAGTSFDDFLRGNYAGGEPQPEWYLVDLFGRERANIYLNDKNISVRNLTRENGEKIPLQELRNRYVRATN